MRSRDPEAEVAGHDSGRGQRFCEGWKPSKGMGVGSEETRGVYRFPLPFLKLTYIFLWKDPGLEILQPEDGSLAHWSGHSRCCGDKGEVQHAGGTGIRFI